MIEGEGSPEGVVPAQPGRSYRDTVNNYLYLKMGGTMTLGWRHVGTCSASTLNAEARILTTEADPNGTLSFSGPAVCFGTGAVAGAVWAKTTSGTSNNEWVAIINPA